MELLEGRTLRQKLNDDGRLSPPAALQLGEQLMLALAHAHNEGVVHRDLKPDNVFLLNQSDLRLHVKVLDFGVSTIIGDATSVGFKTETGATVGTPRYMAPEQLAAKPATPRSDLYSLAVVLFESMTGQIPELMGPRCAAAARTCRPAWSKSLSSACTATRTNGRSVPRRLTCTCTKQRARSAATCWCLKAWCGN